MEPVIHTGSVIFVNEKDKDVDVGDIVTFHLQENGSHEMTVTHRVAARESMYFITKGDANDTQDFFHISPGQIIGKYKFQIPYAGYLLYALQQLLKEKNISF